MPVLIAGGVSLIMMLVPRIEPLQQRMGESAPFYRAVWLGLLALFALIQAMVTLPAFGLHLPGELIFVAVGIFFMLMGNLLPKTRPSFFVGIRTPWTLSDPENWIATHRFGGRTMMAGGLLLCFVAFAPATVRTQLLLTAIGIGAVPPVLYSYLYWRRHRAG
jgi:uncharacterized membrane protein